MGAARKGAITARCDIAQVGGETDFNKVGRADTELGVPIHLQVVGYTLLARTCEPERVTTLLFLACG